MIKTYFKYRFASMFAYCLLTCYVPLSLISCSDDDDVLIEEEEGWDTELRGSIATDETISYPAALLGTIQTELSNAFATRFINLNSTVDEDTEVLIVSGSDLSSFVEEITTVYDNDGIIVITNPDVSETNIWFEEMGLPYELVDNGEDKELYAFSQNHQYTLDCGYEGISANEHLNYFVSWVNETLVPVFNIASPGNGVTDLAQLMTAQTVTYTVNYSLAIEEAHALASNPDSIKGHGSFTAKYSIYPVYGFEGQQGNGDYYVVSAEYTAHNTDMCPVDNSLHKWSSWHGKVKCQLCGFYLKEYTVETMLSDVANGSPIGEFVTNCSPTPQTTQSSTSYTSGVSHTFGINVGVGATTRAGANASFTANYGVTWNNSTTKTISDVGILNQSTENTVKYTFLVNNLPTHVKGHISDPPLVSVSNATLSSSWIWRVPTTTDRATYKFYIGTRLANITYGSSHMYSSAVDYEEHWNSPKIPDWAYWLQINAPGRVPTGLLKITNNDSEYISDIEIIDAQGNVEYSSTGRGSLAPDSVFTRYLPIGAYTIKFNKGATAASTKPYVLIGDPINIVLGETYGLNSAFDFEEQE